MQDGSLTPLLLVGFSFHLTLCFSFWHLLSAVSVKLPEGLAPKNSWNFSHQTSAPAFLGSFIWQTIWALLLLCSNYWERKLKQLRQFSDCSYPQRFTMAPNCPIHFFITIYCKTCSNSKSCLVLCLKLVRLAYWLKGVTCRGKVCRYFKYSITLHFPLPVFGI